MSKEEYKREPRKFEQNAEVTVNGSRVRARLIKDVLGDMNCRADRHQLIKRIKHCKCDEFNDTIVLVIIM
jgi:hypothetical protein